MTRRPSHPIGVLCLLGTLAVAGCATRGHAATAPTGTSTVIASAPAATASPTPDAAVDQQLTNIDDQLNTIDGQLNAANAGLNSSEGNPAQ